MKGFFSSSETKEKPAPVASAASQDDFVQGLAAIYQRMRYSKKLPAAMREVERDLLDLMGVKLITVYQCVEHCAELLATFKAGDSRSDDAEIRVPFSPGSIAGYVALSQRSLLIKDVNDRQELTATHPRLRYNSSFSEARGWKVKSQIVVPIKDEVLLGVLQLVRFEGDPEFTRLDLKYALMLSQLLAKQFRSSLQSTQGPYDYLVQRGKITAQELAALQKRTSSYGGTMSRALMESEKIEADLIGKSLELYFRVPYLGYDPNRELPMELLQNIGLSYLRSNLWLPIGGDKQEAIILIDDPSDYRRIMEIQGVVNARNFSFRVGLAEHILQYLHNESGELEKETGFDEVFSALDEQMNIELEEDDDDDEELAATSAVIQLVNKIITESERQGASDIHIEPGKDGTPGVVRIRVDGSCRELLKVPKEHTAALIARIKVIARLDIAERRLPQDGKCKLKVRNRKLELRVATMPTVHGESAVLRLLAAGSAMPLNNLNLSKPNYDKIIEQSTKPHGLFLVVGPTGSGKTTTLHAVLGHINTPDRKIWTAEDPVEITQPGLQQVQMLPKINFTFATAMRAFLRADPDVILIGEMRDRETAAIGVEASLTGHLVLSTLHTNSAPETIIRLLDLGLDPVNFSDALLGVLAQRLMRTLCNSCKEAYKPDQRELEHLISVYGEEDFQSLEIDPTKIELFRQVGCTECGDTGYRGRTGIHELLIGTHELQSMIYHKASLDEIRRQAKQDGMRSMKQDGIEKILAGLSDYQQLLRVVAD
ncbi:MAG: GspE/PulE family protein [Gammaproteobacteria bacterium]|nr:GspE/PulE family protein [Pseudomonadales bacterium]MCP5346760.1 GspE/PulE family protein [Pseudomonadales bacterium]